MERMGKMYRGFVTWVGPFGQAIFGMVILMLGTSAGKPPNIAISVIGGLIILGAFESYAERAKLREAERWASMISNMIVGEKRTSIEVSHTWEPMRPHLDARIAELVAQAIEARSDKTGTGLAVGESAARKGAPKGGHPTTADLGLED